MQGFHTAIGDGTRRRVEVRPEREIQDRAGAACGVNVEILVMVTLLSLAIGNAEVWA
jgi:hypothetical protein